MKVVRSNYIELLEKNRKYLWNPFTQMASHFSQDPPIIERGEGVRLIDVRGKVYYDGTASLWLNVWGHGHPILDEAIKKQLDKIAHTTLLGAAHPTAIVLAEELIKLTPTRLQKVFFSDNGAAAVEVGLKMAFLYWHYHGYHKKRALITFQNAYHGDTLGSMSVGRIPLYHSDFETMGFPTYTVHYPHPYRFPGTESACCTTRLTEVETLLDSHHQEIAGMIVEPMIQGAGGMIRMPSGFLKGLEKLCRKYQVLLLLDEVATGFGRTGPMFACEHEEVKPDILMVGKQLTGGYLPVSATIVTDSIYYAFYDEQAVPSTRTLYHGHSYAGNPLGCAAALANLALYEEKQLLTHIQRTQNHLAKCLAPLQDFPYVGEVRQLGLAVGIELASNAIQRIPFPAAARVSHHVCQRAYQHGLIIRPLGRDVVALVPPLAATMEELTAMTEILVTSIKEVTPSCKQKYGKL
ncbi:adenosylmethionine--8-amino-7-oxononanoate transaminase [Pasteuria penetrans]|uniref:adenosylmethionine--8-amino-7-oxononanoate transaminase n=1 Tax=Pasteuria penetrans TaxID=86005 RepID=UPI001FE353A5|nr:adenosylmethionine--8-amino-7-oxononanoate transaminase [Pasteuria penetrans]